MSQMRSTEERVDVPGCRQPFAAHGFRLRFRRWPAAFRPAVDGTVCAAIGAARHDDRQIVVLMRHAAEIEPIAVMVLSSRVSCLLPRMA